MTKWTISAYKADFSDELHINTSSVNETMEIIKKALKEKYDAITIFKDGYEMMKNG